MDKALLGTARAWYRVQAKKGAVAEVFIYDQIGRNFFGEGVAAEEFIKELKALGLTAGDTLNVRINSPGGSVFEGIAIHNYLRTLKAKVVVTIDGIAASIASAIAMAGDSIEMPQNAMLMIHNPMMLAIGNAEVMRKAAQDLDQIRDAMATSYLRRIKPGRDELYAMLDAETWLTADEAVAKGFADTVTDPVRAVAQFDLSRYGYKLPAALARNTGAQRARLTLLKT